MSNIQGTVKPGKTALVVLGMHRSGTSALAGLLHELGLEMGSSLMAGRAGENDKGFWEHEKIVSIHDRLLAHFGSSWSDTRPLPPDWHTRDFSRECQDEICHVLEEDFGSQSQWALKDPRLCRLMPLWLPVFDRLDVAPLFLCIVRNPLEVAASLQRRDNMADDHALLLWLQYNLAAVKSTAGCRRRFLTYAQLLEQGAPLLQKILQGWSLLPAGPSVSGAATLLDSVLRHHVVSDTALGADDAVPDTVKRLYRLLHNAALSGAEVENDAWQTVRGSYMESTRLLGPWLDLSDTLRKDLADINISIEELRRENEGLARGLQNAEELAFSRLASIEALEKALQEAQALVQEREEYVQVLDRALREAQALVQERNVRVEELDTALQEATRYVRQHEATISSLTASLEQGRAKNR
jgi:hypothetical protein